MTDKIFINAVKTLIANYFNNNVDVTDGKKITTDDVYIVWSCKTLQNFKALASTTVSDGMYTKLHTTVIKMRCILTHTRSGRI